MPRKNYTRKIKRNKNGGKRPQSNPKSIKKHKNMMKPLLKLMKMSDSDLEKLSYKEANKWLSKGVNMYLENNKSLNEKIPEMGKILDERRKELDIIESFQKKNSINKPIDNNTNNWFNPLHLYKHPPIFLKDLHGYVLPHAGTKYSGNILSHTLRFKPTKKFNRVVILYLPASNKPNVFYQNKEYYHEYFVPWKSFDYYYHNKNIEYVGINILEQKSYDKFGEETIYILSADFSHFLPFQKAIELENKAAKAIMFRNFSKKYNQIIDDLRTFKILDTILPKEFYLQWVGRTRSPGLEAVGYLSFLIREEPKPQEDKPNAVFVTLYDKEMNTRECLGEWFDITYPWTKQVESQLIQKVNYLARRGNRFTNNKNKDIPLSNYTITYLYRKNTDKMIRGWHGIKRDSFFLPDVLLEHSHTNGKWIQRDDKKWKKGIFSLSSTLKKLKEKADRHLTKNYILYESSVIHH